MNLSYYVRYTHLLCKRFYLNAFVAPIDYMRNYFVEKKSTKPRVIQGHCANNPRKRLCVFAHYDKDNQLDAYVVYYLQKLQEADCDIIFVTTSHHLADEDLAKLKPLCTQIIIRDNFGYDFYSYKIGFDAVDELSRYQQVIFTNDSIYGPLFDLTSTFKAMENRSVDMWGLIDSYEYAYHLQSFFLVFNKSGITQPAFKRFWQRARPLTNKTLVITKYEIGISRYFIRKGFRLGAFCHYDDVIQPYIGRHEDDRTNRLISRQKINLTHYLWDKLIEDLQFPFIKVQLLRDNPAKACNVENWPAIVENVSDYDTTYINNHLQRATRKG